MKKIMIGALAILAMGMPLAANAAPPKAHAAAKHEKMTTTSGTVAAWTPDTRMLKLASGEEFKLDAKVKGTDYKTGARVSVKWENKDGAKLAEAVTIK